MHVEIAVRVVYVLAMFMSALDSTIVNVALPAIGRAFHVPPAAMGTINIGYLVSLAMFLPVAGWMGDRFWNKTYISKCTRYIYHCISFMRVRVKYVMLNLFRLLQGMGTGLIPPVGKATLFRTFSTEERPKLSWLLIMLVAFAPALWLVIGGFLVSVLSWWWIFYINIPIGHS